MSPLKGPGETQSHDGSNLRIAIVHARWNAKVISALVSGARNSLVAAGVKEENIVIQDVPGSYELPFAVQRIYAASQVQSSASSTVSATDLLSSVSLTDLTAPVPTVTSASSSAALTTPFDAIIAIGVLIKGETMHFEYISEATSHGLMRVQLDSGVPIVFGLLTVLNEEQAVARAGIDGKGHCHGEDWGSAAVELGVKRRGWGSGKLA
ncbi:hypothetical protein MMC12_007212 [Toensbergia leucococca]|nr:hypothetical protein [Toensbergia leucococca]